MARGRLKRFPGTTNTASFPSRKNGNVPIPCASPIERDMCFVLEFAPWVVRYTAQPFTLKATFSDGTHHTYTPDFQVVGRTSNVLIECKPAAKVDTPHTRQQRKIGEAWADEKDHAFVLITDVHLRAGHVLGNIKLLHRYSRLTVPRDIEQRVRAMVSEAHQGICIGALVSALHADVEPDPWLPPRGLVYALVWQHVLAADVTTPLTDTSTTWLYDDTHQEDVYGTQLLLEGHHI